MGFGALIAAIQGSVTAPPKSLWVNGLDVLREAGPAGNLFGVPEGTIELVERGPGGTSSLKFVINDPTKDITINEGDRVHYWDHTNGRPLFKGWVQTWTPRPWGLGRKISVTCVGQEIVLDWMVIPSLTIPAGTRVYDAVQAAAGAAIGIGFPLRAFHSTDQNSNQAGPVGHLSIFDDLNAPLTGYALTFAGESLRQAIGKIIAAAPNTALVGFDFVKIIGYGVVTIDFYDGLRFYRALVPPDDYATLTVSDTFAGALAAADLEHTFDGGGRVRQVQVIGGNAAGSGIVPDGSGKTGATATITDSSILSSDVRDQRAKAYMADKSLSGRGTFKLNANTIATNVHPGSTLDLTDAETGATGTYPIGSITKRFHGGRQDWVITYGGLPASFAAAVRRLTRGTLS